MVSDEAGVPWSPVGSRGGATPMTLLDDAIWTSTIVVDGWERADDDYPVIEPATGKELGRLGRAGVADVARAAERAASAQTGWAALPYTERARVLRRAGDPFTQHADEIGQGGIPEAGGIPPQAGAREHNPAGGGQTPPPPP